MFKKILLTVLVLVVVGYTAGRLLTSPEIKIKPGQTIQPLTLTNIHGVKVEIPSKDAKWVHLQFRRFAGCPICNLHLQSIIKRHADIKAAGIKEVVVFHSPDEKLLPYQGKFPFDVVGDPDKVLYKQFGVESSIFSILDVRAWPAIFKGNSAEDKPEGDPDGGPLGLPADFLIDSQGKVVASHYGVHAYDQWSVDELLSIAKK
jgi:peroxiredoxin